MKIEETPAWFRVLANPMSSSRARAAAVRAGLKAFAKKEATP